MPCQPAAGNGDVRPATGRLGLTSRTSRHLARHAARALIVAVLAGTLAGAVSGCGQRGPLFLPDKDNPDKRR